jgi:hypothetical protein
VLTSIADFVSLDGHLLVSIKGDRKNIASISLFLSLFLLLLQCCLPPFLLATKGLGPTHSNSRSCKGRKEGKKEGKERDFEPIGANNKKTNKCREREREGG